MGLGTELRGELLVVPGEAMMISQEDHKRLKIWAGGHVGRGVTEGQARCELAMQVEIALRMAGGENTQAVEAAIDGLCDT